MGGRRLGLAPDVFVEGRDRERDRDARAARSLGEHVDVADDHRAARDDAERGARLGEGLDARAGEAVAALCRLVRVGGGADRDALARPGGAGELASEDIGNIDLDADRRAVAVVRGPVGAPLEGADVTEGAAVDAAHVRVERPVEHHSPDAVQCAAARLFAVLGSHAAHYTNICSLCASRHSFGADGSPLPRYAHRGWRVEPHPLPGWGCGRRFLGYTQVDRRWTTTTIRLVPSPR